jgi:hypothetical protein
MPGAPQMQPAQHPSLAPRPSLTGAATHLPYNKFLQVRTTNSYHYSFLASQRVRNHN